MVDVLYPSWFILISLEHSEFRKANPRIFLAVNHGTTVLETRPRQQ